MSPNKYSAPVYTQALASSTYTFDFSPKNQKETFFTSRTSPQERGKSKLNTRPFINLQKQFIFQARCRQISFFASTLFSSKASTIFFSHFFPKTSIEFFFTHSTRLPPLHLEPPFLFAAVLHFGFFFSSHFTTPYLSCLGKVTLVVFPRIQRSKIRNFPK